MRRSKTIKLIILAVMLVSVFTAFFCVAHAEEPVPETSTATQQTDPETTTATPPTIAPPTVAPPQTTAAPVTAPPTTAAPARPTPRLIVSKYSYGSSEIEAGTDFTLSIELKNTSAYYALDNVMVTLNCGPALKLRNTSNSIYITSIPLNSSVTENVQISTIATDPNAAATVTVNMQFEYVDDNSQRFTGNNSSETLVIPVVYKDRIVVGDPVFAAPSVYFNSEATIILPVTNMGRTTVNNLQASLDADLQIDDDNQYKGNLAPGEKAEFSFKIKVEDSAADLKFTVSYEDAAGKAVSAEKTLTLDPGAKPDESATGAINIAPAEKDEGKPGNKTVMTVAIVVLIAAVIAAVVIMFISRKRANKEKLDAELREIAERELREENNAKFDFDDGVNDASDLGELENTPEFDIDTDDTFKDLELTTLDMDSDDT